MPKSLYFASFFVIFLACYVARAFNSPTYLPALYSDHPGTKRAIKFLEAEQIFDLAKLRSRLEYINKYNISHWHDLANAYRHLPHESGAWPLAWNICQKILEKKKLRPRDRSFAAINLSKIAGRENNLFDRFVYAKFAVELDTSNGYAWHRLGDAAGYKKARKQAYYQALKIAKDTNNWRLKTRALDGLSNINLS